MAHDIKVFARADLTREVAVVLGTRPGIVMLAPVLKELERKQVPHFTIHTGQHYSPNMDAQFFADIGLLVAARRTSSALHQSTQRCCAPFSWTTNADSNLQKLA